MSFWCQDRTGLDVGGHLDAGDLETGARMLQRLQENILVGLGDDAASGGGEQGHPSSRPESL